MSKPVRIITLILIFLLLVACIAISFDSKLYKMWYEYTHLNKISISNSDKLIYEDLLRQVVEDYNAEVATYIAFKDSENESERQLAEKAKTEANQAALHYNYLVRDLYMFSDMWEEDNIPADIPLRLLLFFGE